MVCMMVRFSLTSMQLLSECNKTTLNCTKLFKCQVSVSTLETRNAGENQ